MPGWRWLNLRDLSERLVTEHSGWTTGYVTRVVFCTARIAGADNPGGARDQDVYLRALREADAVDVIEFGAYVHRVARSPLAVPSRRGRPILTAPQWPVMV